MAKIVLDENEFPSNPTKKSKKVAPIREVEIIEEGALIEEPKKAIRGRVLRKKKSITRSIADAFVSEDGTSVLQYVVSDVLIPAAKSMIQDMVTQGIEMFLFGEGGGSRRPSRDKSIVSYNKKYHGRDDDRRPVRTSRRDKFDLSDIYFRSASDATDVLEALCEQLEEYDQVSVATYFDLAGIEGATHAHYKWGWEDRELRRARCIHTRSGWAISLPDPIELD